MENTGQPVLPVISICQEYFKVEKWTIWTICAFDRNLSNFSKRICGPSRIVPDWSLSNILKKKALLMETYWESFKGQCGSNYISHTWYKYTSNLLKKVQMETHVLFIKTDQFFLNVQSGSNRIVRDWSFFQILLDILGNATQFEPHVCASDKIGQIFVKA